MFRRQFALDFFPHLLFVQTLLRWRLSARFMLTAGIVREGVGRHVMQTHAVEITVLSLQHMENSGCGSLVTVVVVLVSHVLAAGMKGKKHSVTFPKLPLF